MILHRSAARRVSTFVICSFALLPLGRNAAARRLSLPAISAQAASAASPGGQRAASPDPLEAAFDHAALTEPVRQAIRFIMTEADSGKVEIGRLSDANKSKGSVNLYATYAVYDYRARLAAMLNESAKNTGLLYTNAMIGAGQVLYDAARIAYCQYRNPHAVVANLVGEIPDPGDRKKGALLEAGFTILASYDKDPETRTRFGIGWNPSNPGPAVVQRPPSEDFWRTGPVAPAQIYAAALAAPSAHTGPPPDTALHFDANPDGIAYTLKPALASSMKKDNPAPLPEAAAILASNDPPYKQAVRHDPGAVYMLNEVYPSVLKEYRDLYPQSLLAQAVRAGPRPDDPQRPFPVVMTEIIAREAKFYSGADLAKLSKTVGDLIAPNMNMARVDAQRAPLRNADGSAQFMSEAEVRAQLSGLIERLHGNGQDQEALTALSGYIHLADKKLFSQSPQPIQAQALPRESSASNHFDSDPNHLHAALTNYVARFQNDPRNYPLTVPAAILVSNDPALKETENQGRSAEALESVQVLIASLQKEYFTLNRLPTPPERASVPGFPEMMTAIIARSAKSYSGDDLTKLANVVGNLIAPNMAMAKVDQNRTPITDPASGKVQLMSEGEVRTVIAELVERLHKDGDDATAREALIDYIARADKKILSDQTH